MTVCRQPKPVAKPTAVSAACMFLANQPAQNDCETHFTLGWLVGNTHKDTA